VIGAPRVFVVTCPVPPGLASRLRLEVVEHTVTAVSKHGFRHSFRLPREVAVERLESQVFGNVLEIRMPYLPGGGR
jgi:hypothetical protein